MFDKIKKWYELNLWTKVMVGNAVKKEVITAEEYKLITGEAYIE